MPLSVKSRRRPRLPLLGTSKVRIAQLSSTHSFESAHVFPPERWSQVRHFGPHILVGSSADLQRFVERIDLRTIAVDSLDHSIFVVTEVGDQPLSDVLRVVLWQRFGVPVFELYTDGHGTLLAFECEAHNGWHVTAGKRFAVYGGELVLQRGSETAVRTGLVRQLESETCVCGREGVRILQTAENRRQQTEPILAAIA